MIRSAVQDYETVEALVEPMSGPTIDPQGKPIPRGQDDFHEEEEET
ncbi:MAG: hypothetical protein V3V49_07820 [Candidatus Krumholzibacteria bacterium]